MRQINLEISAGVLRIRKMNTPKLSWQQLIRQRLKLISLINLGINQIKECCLILQEEAEQRD